MVALSITVLRMTSIIRQVFKSDITDLTAEMEVMRKSLDRERIRSSELEIKLAALDQDMAFQIQV